MKKELENKLFNKYPKIFSQKNLSMQETCMCWGIETDDGWYNIIDILCNSIKNFIEYTIKEQERIEANEPKRIVALPNKTILKCTALQVKEKFGGLRFYTDSTDDYILGLISMAEAISRKTCESCGNLGFQNKVGWMHTLCEPCRENRNLRWERGTQSGIGLHNKKGKNEE